ncbi:MAG: hypothetical protein ICV60_22870, partial [Pyrinomonadaceae bacterium]|nr:hypothetical protein [Pyrinomonadaceae bacterium]
DSPQFYVAQHYRDFLSREPDAGGLGYWSNEIAKCGSDQKCIDSRRVGISAAFFIELEFQQTGSVIYRLYKAAYGERPSYAQFMPDRSQLVAGPQLQQSTLEFTNRFVQRTEFRQAYPDSLTPEQYVNKLFDTAGLTPYANERASAVQLLKNGGTRTQVLLDVINQQAFKDREYNPSFVLMQYFGYLRRDPEEGGYRFWLDVLNNKVPGNYRGMVCAFLTSAEYQVRFSPVITRNDKICSGLAP